MNRCWLRTRNVIGMAALLIVAFVPAIAGAQGALGGGIGGGIGGGVGGGLGGTSGTQQAGVVINADGVLKMKIVPDPDGRTSLRIAKEAMASLDPKLREPAEKRKISLNRLEKAVAAKIAAGEPIPDEMKYLAGLRRVENVFFYPETGDIVVAGPAEGYAVDAVGRVRGLSTGRPMLLLEDLAAALRCYPPSGAKKGVISVSIDPTEEGLNSLNTFIKKNARALYANPHQATVAQFAMGMRQQLGLQDVTFQGVSPETHFAQVLVEADYRMKLIGIGLQRAPVPISTFIQVAGPGAVAGNALVRWYFVPEYKCIRVTEDGTAMQMEGEGVKLVGAQELVQQGVRRDSKDAQSQASKKFCHSFTKMYPELAKREPVYAQLRNVIDMAIAAAFIQQQGYYAQAGWDLGVLGEEAKYSIENHPAPKHVESAVNAVWKGNMLQTPIGGGVTIQPLKALEKDNRLLDEDGTVAQTQQAINLKSLAAGQWWWD